MPQETSSELEPDDPDAESFVEVDPSGRYGRYKEVLGKGAFKKVYRAFDEWEGIEVAWNQVKVAEIVRNSEDLERLYSEVNLLKTLNHKNIIKFYNSWVDTKNEHINFITEIFTSGTLRQYRKKHKRVDLRALKNWSRQILEGLLYLHGHDPPIIHRDLKCDNIFVNGNHGEVKIGDLGFAAILRHANAAHSVIGTPEFMAPELYEEEYNELVDIYAFGMCMLELVTFEYPYVECSNAAQIYKKVTSGIKPASLAKVNEPSVKAFIEKCIANVSERMSAEELLRDPFLSLNENQDNFCHSFRIGPVPLDGIYNQPNHAPSSTESPVQHSNVGARRDYVMQSERKDANTIFIKLRIADAAGHFRNIHFPFDTEADTSIAVASEMVHELDLTDQDVTNVADMIDSEVRAHIPEWSPRESSAEESVFDSYGSESRDVVASPLTTTSVYSSGSLVLEQLSSGRKVWSDSPKAIGGSGSSPLRRTCSLEVSSQPKSSMAEGSERRYNSARNSHGDEDAYYYADRENVDENDMVRSGGRADEISRISYCGNSCSKLSVVESESEDSETMQKVESESESEDSETKQKSADEEEKETQICSTSGMAESQEEDGGPSRGFDPEEVRILVEKVDQVLLEQEKEIDELRIKHKSVISDMLKGVSPEVRGEVLKLCKCKTSYHVLSSSQVSDLLVSNSGASSLVGSPAVSVSTPSLRAIRLGKVKESATGAEGIAIGPIFRDRLNSMKKRSVYQDVGIAVILRDDSEKSE